MYLDSVSPDLIRAGIRDPGAYPSLGDRDSEAQRGEGIAQGSTADQTLD